MYDFQEILQKITRNTLTTLNLQAIRTLDSSEMREKKTLSEHSRKVRILVPLPDGRLASRSEDGAIKVWNVQTGECLHTLSAHSSNLRVLVPLPDGRLASGGKDGAIKVWDLEAGQCLHTLSAELHGYAHSRSLASLQGGRLASLCGYKTIKVWDVERGQCLHTLSGSRDLYPETIGSFDALVSHSALTALPDGRLASLCGYKTIKVWNVETGQCLHTLSEHSSDKSYASIRALVPLPDDRLASLCGYKTIKVWNVQTGECLHTLSEHSSNVQILVPLPDGRLASGSSDGTIKVWNVQTGECLHSLSEHSSNVQILVPLSDGRLASGHLDDTIKVWNVQTGECLHSLSKHNSGRRYASTVSALFLLPDGRLAIQRNQTIEVWDIEKERELNLYRAYGLGRSADAVIQLQDGCLVTARGETVEVWEIPMCPLKQNKIITLLELLTHNHSLNTLSLGDVFSLPEKRYASLKDERRSRSPSPVRYGFITPGNRMIKEKVLSLLETHPAITTLDLTDSTRIDDTFIKALIKIVTARNLLTKVTLDKKNTIAQMLLWELRVNLKVNALQKRAQQMQLIATQPHPTVKIPSDYLCPINQTIMSDPVTAADGNTYEREAIEKWLKTHCISPLEGSQMPHRQITPNKTLKRIIVGFLDKNPQLRLSEEFHQSETMHQQLIQAITSSQYDEIQQCVKKDPRFLTQHLIEQKHLLQLACEHKDYQVLQTVIELLGEKFWAFPLPNAGFDYFILAARNSGAQGASLISKQLEWEREDFQGQFLQSLYAQDTTLMDVCLELGASVNQADNDGHYPLHLAVKRQQQPLLDYLLQKGAVVLEATDKAGNSALHIAAQQDNKRMIETLMRVGANYKKANNKRLRPIDINPFVREISQQIKTERYVQSFNASLNSNDIIRQLQKEVTLLKQELVSLKQTLHQEADSTAVSQPSIPKATPSTTTSSSPKPSSTHAATFFGGTIPKPVNQVAKSETPITDAEDAEFESLSALMQ